MKRRLMFAALTCLLGCIPTYIRGVSYDDDPKWDCDIVSAVACTNPGEDIDAWPVDGSTTQCRAFFKGAPHATILSDCSCDVTGLVTCVPDIRTAALHFRRTGLTRKPQAAQ